MTRHRLVVPATRMSQWLTAGGVCLVVLFSAVSQPVAASADALRPNVVVFLVDDLGWMDLSCQGSAYYETPYSVVRSGHWKLIKHYEGPTFELYNLADDLSEKHDLAPSMPAKVRQLDRKLTRHLTAVGAKLPKPNPKSKPKPKPKPKPAHQPSNSADTPPMAATIFLPASASSTGRKSSKRSGRSTSAAPGCWKSAA